MIPFSLKLILLCFLCSNAMEDEDAANGRGGDEEQATMVRRMRNQLNASSAREKRTRRVAEKRLKEKDNAYDDVHDAADDVVAMRNLQHQGSSLLDSPGVLGSLSVIAADLKNDSLRSSRVNESKRIAGAGYLIAQGSEVDRGVRVVNCGAAGFVGVKRSYDGTRHYMTVKSKDRFAAVIKKLKIPEWCLRGLKKKKHRFLMEIMQQRCFVQLPNHPASPVYLPAKVLAKGNGECIGRCIDSSVPALSADNLSTLTDTRKAELLIQTVADMHNVNDGYPVNVALRNSRAFVDINRCEQHVGNLAVNGALEECGDVTKVGYQIYTCFQDATNQSKFMIATGRSLERMHVHEGMDPPAECKPYSDWLVDCTIGRFLAGDAVPKKHRAHIELHRRVFNGRLWMPPEHFCNGCHRDRAHVIEEAFTAMTFLMEGLWDPSRKPSDKDFFKTLDYYRAWAYGLSVHQLGL